MAIWTEYTTKNVPEDEDTLMIYDASGNENKQLPVSGMSKKIVNDVLEKKLDIETESKTIPGAVNELHGDIEELVDETLSISGKAADAAKSGEIKRTVEAILDGTQKAGDAKKVNGHTVNSDVPENAVFTDTVYDDSELKQSIADIESGTRTVGNSTKVNNHTVNSDVPENAKFTDTVYDDAKVREDIGQLKEDLGYVATTFEVDTLLENKYIGTNGSLNNHNGLSVSNLYRVNDKVTSIRIDMSALSGLSATIYIAFYSRPSITSIFYVSGMKYTEISSPNISIPSNAKYFAFCWKTSENKPKIFQNGDVKEYSAKDIINECLPIEQPSVRYSICLVGDSITQGYGSTGYQQYTKEIDGKNYSIRGDGPDNPLGVKEGDFLYETDTRKWYEARSGAGWGQKLKSYIYECSGTSVRNFGMTGVNSSDVLKSLDNFLDTKKYFFDAFVVMVGTNDRGNNTKIQFYNNLTDIVKKIQGNGKPVILMSALPASSTNENIKPYHMLDVNNIISKVSSENNAPFISFFNLINEYINISSEKLEDLLVSDGLHPNDHGHDIMLNELLKSIGLGMKK